MTVTKSDLWIAETYTSLASTQRSETVCEKGSPRSTPASCMQALLEIIGNENLLDNSPVLQRSIRLRNPYVDPLSYIQVSLLRRLRALPEDSSRRETVLNTLLLTTSGISSGMLNRGSYAKISPRGKKSRLYVARA